MTPLAWFITHCDDFFSGPVIIPTILRFNIVRTGTGRVMELMCIFVQHIISAILHGLRCLHGGRRLRRLDGSGFSSPHSGIWNSVAVLAEIIVSVLKVLDALQRDLVSVYA